MSRNLPKRVLKLSRTKVESKTKDDGLYQYYCSYKVFGTKGAYTGDCVIKEASPTLTDQVCDQFKLDILNALNKENLSVDALVFLTIKKLG